MFRVRRIGTFSALATAVLVAAIAVPAAATPLSFGAKLTSQSQPTNSDSCHNEVNSPKGVACTWVARTAFENGSKYTAPATGTLHHLKLVSCVSGSFTLQIVKLNAKGHAKLVRNGPHINYAADPRNADDNCGNQNGDTLNYIVQSFSIHVAVEKGDYIAVKAAKVGTLHCSSSGIDMYSPVLAPNQAYRSRSGGTGCDLLVGLQY